jgi:polysaccharide export outer membrane protein
MAGTASGYQVSIGRDRTAFSGRLARAARRLRAAERLLRIVSARRWMSGESALLRHWCRRDGTNVSRTFQSAARRSGRRRSLSRFVLRTLTLFSLCATAFAQTAEQLAIFQSLPPEQQKAILEALSQPGGPISGTSTAPAFEVPTTVVPRLPDDMLEPVDDPNNPRLKAGDTLIVDFRLLREEGEQRVLVEPPAPALPPTTLPTMPTAPATPAPTPAPAQPRADSGPAVLIERTPVEEARAKNLLERVRRGNPYRLDTQGFIELPGLAAIPLAGLTVYQAAQRLAAEPYLKDFAVDLVRLPVEPTGTEALKPFGYDLFLGTATTFAPATDIPVPTHYVIGPGDIVQVQLLGNVRGSHALVVNRNGTIDVPDLGPIAVAGLSFDAARDLITSRVETQMIGVRVNIALGELRSMRVFVLGDANQPGSYTVSGLSTITNALYVSGGVKPIGSLRNIQLKRAGKTVGRLDLYDLLLSGDTSGDVRLQPGDVIFIPPVGATVGVSGEVRRPAIYEVGADATVTEIVRLAGGLTPDADPSSAKVERIDERRLRTTVNVNLASAQAAAQSLRAGDVLRVPRVRPTLTGAVELTGHVFHPGTYQFRNGMRITDVLGSIEELKPDADLNYVLIRRERPGDRHVSIVSADLASALRARGSAEDILLSDRDRIHVFDTVTSRDRVVAPIVEELQRQGRPDEPSAVVAIGGKVKVPGSYPLESGMRVSDLVRAGGNLDVSAYSTVAELTRYSVIDGQKRETSVVKVDLARALAREPTADLLLNPFDVLVVQEISEWSDLEYVTLEGEVRFPGSYTIKRGETLKSVVERAGGLTDLAFADGSVFTREDLRQREKKQLEVLADRLQRDLATLALEAAQSSPQGAASASESVAVGQNLLSDLRQTEAVGRLVIDLEAALTDPAGGANDIVLRDGDRLAVPKRAQEVTVIGEVQSATSHLYSADLSRDDYIAKSGGATQKADEKRIFVVRANGSVESSGSSSQWFRLSRQEDISPGDTIVVPLDAERMRPLPLWTAVTTIIYNLAVAVAAVNSF